MSTTAAPEAVRTVNPATGEPLAEYRPHDHAAVERALDAARSAYVDWRATDFGERSALFERIALYLRAHKSELATLVTNEMGKPLVEAEAEVEKCAVGCEYFARQASALLADEPMASSATESYVGFRPLGTVLAIMPWNFPLWQVFRFAAPALMAGNVGILKHAANVTGCALAIEEIFTACDAPPGLFATIVVPGREMERVVADSRIAAVTLTGSEAAGSSVASLAGKHIKKSVLELGGSDAFVVLADADIDAAAAVAVKSRFQNTGQSCIAAKRFIVEAGAYDDFLEAFVAKTRDLVVADPLERTTQVGPLARADLRDSLAQQVEATRSQGARVALGGKALERAGFFYAPTILADVDATHTAFREETFGPAAAVVRARDAEHAVELANDSEFGLGGNLWTRDLERARGLAARLESGSVFINGMTASDPRLPFGGVKKSGYGRELSSYGIKEFVNVQTVWIGPARPA
jgi:succinate-semialdehyde dehydrogenase/glutarate-semialdehyde dehydrogenase